MGKKKKARATDPNGSSRYEKPRFEEITESSRKITKHESNWNEIARGGVGFFDLRGAGDPCTKRERRGEIEVRVWGESLE